MWGYRFFLLAGLAGLGLLVGCQSGEKPQIERPMAEIYTRAFQKSQERDWETAADEFAEVERQHPYSAWAAKAQLMSAYASYKRQDFERAIGMLDNFITLRPYHPQAVYAYYLRAVCHYAQIGKVDRDPKTAELSLEALEELLNRFPASIYARDARLKRDYVLSYLAGQQVEVGRFYLKQNDYLAALRRFQNTLRLYPMSPQTPEVLHRIVECCLALGLRDEAQRAAATLGHNFVDSIWYQDTHRLMQQVTVTPKGG